MGVSLEIYRANIRRFNCYKINLCKSYFHAKIASGRLRCFMASSTFIMSLILLSGDVEVNPGPSRNLTLNVGHINARSLNVEDKCDEIAFLVVEQRLDIFAVSETWLNQEMSSDLLCIPGFSPMFRRDRNNGRRAGGVTFIYLFQFCI
jgi:hypothetical protein